MIDKIKLSKNKCETCKYLYVSECNYKTYYCMKNEEQPINLGVDYPPKKIPKSCMGWEKNESSRKTKER